MRERIDSLTNKKIKLAASLTNRKHRIREGLFLAEGIRLAEMAAGSGWGLRYALYTAEMARQSRG